MLRDLFYHLFPYVTVEDLISNIQNLKKQIISAEVRLIILKKTNLEESHRINTRIIELQAELNQQYFFLHVATKNDELSKYRTWLEKINITDGPLYVRKFKPWHNEQNFCDSDLFNPLYLRHQSLRRIFQSILHRINLIDSSKNRAGRGDNFSDGFSIENFNIPYIYNILLRPTIRNLPSTSSFPYFTDSVLPMPSEFPNSSTPHIELAMQLIHLAKMLVGNEIVENALFMASEPIRSSNSSNDRNSLNSNTNRNRRKKKMRKRRKKKAN
uniref:Uncharacterized protein n=1 Tax=Onchocerca volvulus TaxID=6282 RepID=A0A8R1XMY5_ONCVO